MTKKFNELVSLTAQWFIDTGIKDASCTEKQFLKATEELGEIAQAFVANNIDEIKKEVGDYIVTLIGTYQHIDDSLISSLKQPRLWSDAQTKENQATSLSCIMAIHGYIAEMIAKGKLDKAKIENMSYFIAKFCDSCGIDMKDCLELAYNKISKRKGKMINGIFVKEEDLK